MTGSWLKTVETADVDQRLFTSRSVFLKLTGEFLVEGGYSRWWRWNPPIPDHRICSEVVDSDRKPLRD